MDTETGGGGKPDFQKKIQDLVQGLDLSEDTLDKAIEIMEQYRSHFKVNDEHLPPAVVHIASRVMDEPRTQKMIADHLEDRNQLFGSNNDRLRRRLRENVKKLRKQPDLDLSIVRSRQHLDYIVSQLDHIDISDEVLETAEKYCEAVEKSNRVSRSKVAIAGCCLKQALDEQRENPSITHTQLAEVTAMNEKTFENNLEYIRENDLLPE